MGLNKTTLIAKVAELSGLSKVDSEKALKAIIDAVTAELAAKGDVKLIGFGTFSTVEKQERMGKNPQNGQPIKIAAKTSPKFKPGAALVTACNPVKVEPKKKGKKK